MLLEGGSIALYSHQGEKQHLINLMADLDLHFFLSQGIIIYTEATKLGYATSIINLIFNSIYLAEYKIVYANLDTDYGSNYTAIQMVIALDIFELLFTPPCLLFKSFP